MSGRRSFLALACIGAIFAAPGTARAQTSSSSSGGAAAGSESINAPVPNPNRFLFQNGQYVDVTSNPRPQNLNPTGVNFSDCEQDLRLDFALVISGFKPSDYAHIEVWAGTVDCTQDANRNNINAGVSQPCWRVHGDLPPQNAVTSYAMQPLSIYARDVLRFEQPITSTGVNTTYDGTFHDGPNGENACFVQTSDAGVQLSVYFIPVGSNHQAMGTAYQYPLNTDLVAPPPPYNLMLNAGDSLLQVHWTSPGNDPDLVGFAVWSDPPASGSTTGGCNCGTSLGSGANSYVPGAFAVPGEDAACMDAESDAVEEGEAGASDAGATDVATETAASEGGGEGGTVSPEASVSDAATEAGPVDASGGVDTGAGGGSTSCSGITVGVEGGACYSSALESRVFTLNGGGSSTPVTTTGDSGTTVGGEGGVALAGGGISSINPKYEVGEIDDFTATQLTLTGLTNGESYTIVVTSIDGSGNVGPVSTPAACGKPEPTNDYWKTYKKDNGSALGCALEYGSESGADVPLFALGVAAVAAAFIRRRTRR